MTDRWTPIIIVTATMDDSYEEPVSRSYAVGKDGCEAIGVEASSCGLFESVGRPAYLQIDLDVLTKNITILRGLCKNKHIDVIGVVKASAYGHGSVQVSRHLKSHCQVERLAVATVSEAIWLRNHDIPGTIHVLGNVLAWEMAACVDYNLIPSISSIEPLVALSRLKSKRDTRNGLCTTPVRVHIKLDTGMCRNGCQPNELANIVKACDRLQVHLEGIFTHFADAFDDRRFTLQQLKLFNESVRPFRHREGLKLHAANSAAILRGIATDLDFVRPGIAMYGLPPGDSTCDLLHLGMRPLASIKATPTLVKHLAAGRKVGYGCTYTTPQPQWIATFALGYSDGYWRHLSNEGVIVRDATGEQCHVVGRVSMDAITVLLPCRPGEGETFTIMTADYDVMTSASGIAARVATIAYEVVTRLSERYPKVYIDKGTVTIFPASDCE